jgi:hypothetical protein
MNIEDLVTRFEKAVKTPNGWRVKCPAHDDKRPSLDIDAGASGTILLTCRSGGCKAEAIMGAVGLGVKDLFPEKLEKSKVNPKCVASYQYCDESGEELYVVDRMEPARDGTKKEFFPRHMVDGQWVKNINGVRRVLYRLPQLIKSGDEKVFITEGEGKADVLAEYDCVATSVMGGSVQQKDDGKSKWLDVYTPFFAGKNVVIMPDNDAAGQRHARSVYKALKPVVKSILVASVPKQFNDIKDYLPTLPDDNAKLLAIADMVKNASPCPSMEHEKIKNMESAEKSYSKLCQDVDAPRLYLSRWLPSLKLRRVIQGEVITILAATSVGKSIIAYNMAMNSCGLTSLIFQLELPEAVTFERLGSLATGRSGDAIERDYMRGKTISWRDNKDVQRIWFCSESGLAVDSMSSLLVESESIIGKRPEIVIVDYLQLATGKGKSAYEKTSDVSESLRVFAKTMNVIVIATSQIGRPSFKGRPGAEHDLADNMSFHPVSLGSGKNSGSVENSASVVLGAWRSQEDPHRIYIQPLKGSSGGTSPTPISCNLNPETLRITEINNTQEPEEFRPIEEVQNEMPICLDPE